MKKVLFISSTGGHLSELLQLRPLFIKYEYFIVTEKDATTVTLTKNFEDKISFLMYGTRLNLIKYLFVFSFNILKSLYLLFKINPKVVVTTGTHTAVPMCYLARLLGKKVVFIETFANRNTRTLAGRLVYPIANLFVVQWEEMLALYPKAQYWGWIY